MMVFVALMASQCVAMGPLYLIHVKKKDVMYVMVMVMMVVLAALLLP